MWKLTATNRSASLLFVSFQSCQSDFPFEAIFYMVQYNCTHLRKQILVS